MKGTAFGRSFMSATTTKITNSGPLGLLGFGMTTVLLNLHNAGLSAIYSAVGQIVNGEYGKTVMPLG